MSMQSVAKRKHSAELNRPKRFSGFNIYLWFISACGIMLIGWSILTLPSETPLGKVALLTALVVATQFATATLPVTDNASVTFTVSAGVSIAAIPLYGIQAAVLLEAVSMIALWVIKPHDKQTWQKSLPQLVFNTGMFTLSAAITGLVFVGLKPLVATESVVWFGLRWFLASFVYDQTNLLLFMFVMRLQHGPSFSILNTWRDNYWATVVHVINTFVAGGVLVMAVQLFDWTGILVFFVPIFLSAFAFRVYVGRTKVQMDNLEQIIAERTAELEQLSKEKDAFLAVLSHDMKSPLMTIGTYGGMLREDPTLISRKPHSIDNILHAQGTLVELVNNIIDLEKLQVGGDIDLNCAKFDLNEMLHAVAVSIQPIAERKQIELSHPTEQISIDIVADRFQLERAVTNLVSNAVKSTQKGGKVALAALQEDNSVGLFVIDNGFGIPEEDLPTIFDRFKRVDQHRAVARGTGLGLAITKAIIEAHDGTIDVESSVGQGTRFSIQLPLDKAGDSE